MARKTRVHRPSRPSSVVARAAASHCVLRKAEEIGRGVAGVVYKTCCGPRCTYATKEFFSARGFQQAEREARIQMTVAKAGLAPRVIRMGCGDGTCKIVMELVDSTLDAYIARHGGLTAAQQTSVITLLERVARLGVDHGDVHSGNIAVDGAFKVLRLIDFSESKKSRSVDTHAQVGKLVGDLGVRFPGKNFDVLIAYAAKGMRRQNTPSRSCAEESAFLEYVRKRTDLRVNDENIQDRLLDLWMNSTDTSCEALVQRVRRRFKLAQ